MVVLTETLSAFFKQFAEEGDREIIKMLEEEPLDYRGYLLMGVLLEGENTDQAYLTYENADYLCRRAKREKGMPQEEFDTATAFLHEKLEALRNKDDFHVNPPSFIILSWNTLDLTRKCLESIRTTCNMDRCEVVIVDNNSNDGSKEWLRQQKDIVFVDNDYNAGFPGGCNLGFHAASTDHDMLLLNSDTELTENALYTLRMALYSDRRNGMAGGYSNVNYLNRIPKKVPAIPDESRYYQYGKMVNLPRKNHVENVSVLFAFYVIVRRDVFDRVGEWDELFNPGNYDDHDYSYRVLKAGYRNVLCWNSFIIHRAHRTFKKNALPHSKIMSVNFEKFREKWEFAPDYYSDAHLDMISMIEHSENNQFRALFVGCGCGEAVNRITFEFPQSEARGIEKRRDIADMGAVMGNVICGDPETMELPCEEDGYNYIFLANTLEQAENPELVLEKVKKCLAPGGKIICNIPNALNAENVRAMLMGNFQYGVVGVRNRLNRHFFTYSDMVRLFDKAGYRVEYVLNLVFREMRTQNWKDFFDRLEGIEGTIDKNRMDAHHYVFRLSVKE